MRLRFLGVQGLCRYYWRDVAGTSVLYYVIGAGVPRPVAY